jgi:hypothetical protein
LKKVGAFLDEARDEDRRIKLEFDFVLEGSDVIFPQLSAFTP